MKDLDLVDVPHTPRIKGHCSVCPKTAKLTFEHVPPGSAFNDKPVQVSTLADFENAGGDWEKTEGRIQLEGMGYVTLCNGCNEYFGIHYVPEFKKWAHTGRMMWEQADWVSANKDVDTHFVRIMFKKIRPLPIIKEIIAMFLAMNGEADPTFREMNPELTAFVLDKDKVGLSDKYRIYSALFTGPTVRFAPLHIYQHKGKRILVTAVEHPPFAYVLTIDTPADFLEMAELTDSCSYNLDEEMDFDRVFPLAFGYPPLPMDYRSEARIKADLAAGEVSVVVPLEAVRSDGSVTLRKE